MAAAPFEQSITVASALPVLVPSGQSHQHEHIGAAAYRMLTGCHPADAVIDDDSSFDRHVLASILAVAAMETGPVAERAGLTAADLVRLMARWFPAACGMGLALHACDQAAEDDEIAMVRDLLLAHRSSDGEIGRWLAAMVARRAMEPNHLWEDLGLRDRSELTRLLTRHFGPLAVRNDRNMRWKRFFYRALCESDGFVMCTTPVCTHCRDFELCFGDESGESRMAERRREVVQNAAFTTPAVLLTQAAE
jgi:nitrogen fixation protein NifQ